MKVSRHSWHYRLHSFVFTFFNWEQYGPIPAIKGKRWEHQPQSLCGYFWSTATLTALVPVLTLILLASAPLIGLGLVAFWLHDRYRLWRPKQYKEPSLVRQYVKARKQKVCPLIELTD